ncbi:ATP-dependent protease ATPase subunit HslU [Seleniivibrio woodruffii]|uniref:ATP-dependent protease ATPase subunit HslU n=1 Tax=Seleniivibrio woodruffii TaxID=1078050 RepID=A0A4R1K5S3_9BACT|nr:ATP-dependent protease ATPase subunit HslU [Seleniivibrio woodruffii]TCK59532.1 ATP-dependent HslUV protease ATP-binding subunit HslU [Seleniivibrio woodruffii]TVZ35427.1 ATP-dependent HslUV protease ATP-binding subunit HslU [Seleniivibrio woodruffii]
MEDYTPKKIVEELDKYVVGQHNAKKAVAVALRNRYRRMQLPKAIQEEIAPKNIILIGPTGVGKTEVARRLAKLAKSPFIKVEASKYTEVGYVGRDVESMVRDLMEIAVGMVREERKASVMDKARANAEERLLDLLIPPTTGFAEQETGTREKFRTKLRDGELEERIVEVDVEDAGPNVEVFTNIGMEDMTSGLSDMMKNIFPAKKRKRKMKISEARSILEMQESARLIDMDDVKDVARQRVQQSGIIFLDEIDKICASGSAGAKGGDISREGVQRDLLPIVEGSNVNTKYGMVRTDHILFIAAGAFHTAKPTDLIPELQGRFPIRVELEPLTAADFIRILKEPQNSLTRQYSALLGADGVELEFTDDGIDRIAEMADELNRSLENIGARRLHTIVEKLLEEISYEAPEVESKKVLVDRSYVDANLAAIVKDRDLSRYVL